MKQLIKLSYPYSTTEQWPETYVHKSTKGVKFCIGIVLNQEAGYLVEIGEDETDGIYETRQLAINALIKADQQPEPTPYIVGISIDYATRLSIDNIKGNEYIKPDMGDVEAEICTDLGIDWEKNIVELIPATDFITQLNNDDVETTDNYFADISVTIT